MDIPSFRYLSIIASVILMCKIDRLFLCCIFAIRFMSCATVSFRILLLGNQTQKQNVSEIIFGLREKGIKQGIFGKPEFVQNIESKKSQKNGLIFLSEYCILIAQMLQKKLHKQKPETPVQTQKIVRKNQSLDSSVGTGSALSRLF